MSINEFREFELDSLQKIDDDLAYMSFTELREAFTQAKAKQGELKVSLEKALKPPTKYEKSDILQQLLKLELTNKAKAERKEAEMRKVKIDFTSSKGEEAKALEKTRKMAQLITENPILDMEEKGSIVLTD